MAQLGQMNTVELAVERVAGLDEPLAAKLLAWLDREQATRAARHLEPPLGAQAMCPRIGAHEVAVGDPDLMVALRRRPVAACRDPRIAGVAEHDVDRRDLLATRRPRSLHDPHPEGCEARFGVTHEVEQRGHAGAVVGQCHDLRQAAPIPDARCGGGAIP